MSTQPLTAGFTLAKKYELLRRLSAQHGQGQVWLARQIADNEEVAVKVMIPDDPARAMAAVSRETKALRQIRKSPHVAGFIDSGVSGGYHFVVSELINGTDLHQLMHQSGGQLSEVDLRRAAFGALKALEACHRADVVHNDVKPSNLVMDATTGVVVLVDFGVSVSLLATTEPGAGRTPIFMSPEYADTKPPPASDIFSWASTMVALATGHHAFADAVAPNAIHVKMAEIFKLRSEEPDLSGVPEWLEPLCRWAFDWEPGRRPTARRLLDELEAGRIAEPAPFETEVDPSAHSRGPLSELASRPVASIPAAVVGLGFFRLISGPTLWRLLASATAALAVAALVLRPPNPTTPIRRALSSYVKRWRNEAGVRMPPAEYALVCVLVGLVIQSTLIRAVPNSGGANRAILLFVAGVSLSVPRVVGIFGARKYRSESVMARVVVPLICVALPVVMLQLRDLRVDHFEVVHRSVPWWSAFALSLLVAAWGGIGEAADRSVKFHLILLGLCVLAGAASVAWTFTYHPGGGFGATAWGLYSTEERVTSVVSAACAVIPVAAFRARGWSARVTAIVALLGAACSMLLIGWWVGWLPQIDPWVDYHLPSGFVPWE